VQVKNDIFFLMVGTWLIR